MEVPVCLCSIEIAWSSHRTLVSALGIGLKILGTEAQTFHLKSLLKSRGDLIVSKIHQLFILHRNTLVS